MTYFVDTLNKSPDLVEPAEQQAAINQHYNSIANMVSAFAKGGLGKRGLIINGPAGGGKTEVVRQTLDANSSKYHMLKGTLSAPELFIRIYKHAKDPNQILVIDDTDVCFDDVEMADILKAALDPSGGEMYYGKRSHYLRHDGVPQEFRCEGRIILISNKPLKVDTLSVKAQQRIKPVVDRCLYVPAGLNDAWTAVAMRLLYSVGRIRVLANSTVDVAVKDAIVDLITTEYKRFNGITFRSIQTCLDMYVVDPANWRQLVIMSEGK
tara:strand:+ start:72 stop:869 length:798 start_codon:yes stop_codon:yes gene_type:complete